MPLQRRSTTEFYAKNKYIGRDMSKYTESYPAIQVVSVENSCGVLQIPGENESLHTHREDIKEFSDYRYSGADTSTITGIQPGDVQTTADLQYR